MMCPQGARMGWPDANTICNLVLSGLGDALQLIKVLTWGHIIMVQVTCSGWGVASSIWTSSEFGWNRMTWWLSGDGHSCVHTYLCMWGIHIMYGCILYAHMHACMWVYTCGYTHVCMYVMHVCGYTCIRVLYVCMYACMYAYMRMYVCMYVCEYTHVCVCVEFCSVSRVP